ncbi:MAG: TGS domain-containing protein [Candidatus Coatesbacteria bacterium]|nr:TGS domain-containing protein [Candidatus Coatesbacteria bacterium]
MPANVSPMYIDAEKRFFQAKELPEKIAALEEMWALLPKHKGTEKMQADIKRRMSKLKAELEASKSKKRGFTYTIPKEGAGQIPVIGLPNSGKSSLVSAFTNSKTEVAEYEYTTRIPFPAMMPYKDIFFQLIDLPPFSKEYMETWVADIVKRGDLYLLLIDLTSDFLSDLEFLKSKLHSYHLNIPGFLQYDPVAETLPAKPALVLGTKFDINYDEELFNLLVDASKPVDVLKFSATDPGKYEGFKEKIYNLLNILRVYSKIPGKKPDMDQPFVMKKGDTLLDFAQAVHKDFSENLKFARIWGKVCFEGQQVAKDYILNEGDVIELHL